MNELIKVFTAKEWLFVLDILVILVDMGDVEKKNPKSKKNIDQS